MERLLPLMNGDRLREWVRLGKTLRGNGILRGGDEGVILLMRNFPFPFIHAVLLPGQTTIDSPAVPMIFCMTLQGAGSGLEMSRRVSKGGDLENNMVYVDGCHTAVNWVRWMLSVYDHVNGRMQGIFKCFIQTENKEGCAQAIAMWKQLALKGYGEGDEEYRVEPHQASFKVCMMDCAAGPVRAVEEAFEHLKKEGRGKVLTCQFHFNQCRRKHEQQFLPEEYHLVHRERTEVWLMAKTKEDCEKEFRELMNWYMKACSSTKEAMAMQGWAAFWIKR
jgi:hypothetical protein